VAAGGRAPKSAQRKLEEALDSAAAKPPAAPSTPPKPSAPPLALWLQDHSWASLPTVLALNAAAMYANSGVLVCAVPTATVAVLALADLLSL